MSLFYSCWRSEWWISSLSNECSQIHAAFKITFTELSYRKKQYERNERHDNKPETWLNSFCSPWERWSWRRQWWGRGRSSPAVTGGWWCRRPEPPAVTSGPVRKSAQSHSGLQLKKKGRVNAEVLLYFLASFLISLFNINIYCLSLKLYCDHYHVIVLQNSVIQITGHFGKYAYLFPCRESDESLVPPWYIWSYLWLAWLSLKTNKVTKFTYQHL